MSDQPRRGASALLDEPNPWSEWMADYNVERLSWMRLAALQLAQVPFAMTGNRLAAGLAAVAAAEAALVMELFEDDPDLDGKEVDWAYWLERWHGRNPPYDNILTEFDHELFASYGTGLILSGEKGENGITEAAFLWFMLAAIRGWAERTDDVADIKPGARWIFDLHRGSRADIDPLTALFAHLYDRFRDLGFVPTKRLPDRPQIDKPAMVRSVSRRQERRPPHSPIHAV